MVQSERWPTLPGWDSGSYWMGVATTLAFQQADLDTKENAERGLYPILRARLPYCENLESADLESFAHAIRQLNDDATILNWRVVDTQYGEYTIELLSTEGYVGQGDIDLDTEEWRC